ncbi:MAG: sigma-70 family RNA polymerase sigma factor [Planctomycetes bacterium]|nr:sigma-70 family RNA polymerase sigma factor [Planctomycetota bacterium]
MARDAAIQDLEHQFWAWRFVVFGAKLGKTPEVRPEESAEVLAERWFILGQSLLMGLAQFIIRDEHLAEEAVADALRKSKEAAEGFDGRCPVYWWLRKIVRRASIHQANKRSRRQDAIPFADAPVEIIAADRDRSLVSAADLEAAIEAIIASLPEKQATAIHLLLFQEMTISEIAQLLGDKYDAVHSRVYEAKLKLRDELRRKGFSLAVLGEVPLLANAMRSVKPSSEATARIAALARAPMRRGVIRQPWFMGSMAAASAAALLASISVHAWAIDASGGSQSIRGDVSHENGNQPTNPSVATMPGVGGKTSPAQAVASSGGYGVSGRILMPQSQNGVPVPVAAGEVRYRDNDGNERLLAAIVNGEIVSVSDLPKGLKPGRIIFIDSAKSAARVEFVRAPGPNTEISLFPGWNDLGVLTLDPIAWVSASVMYSNGTPAPGMYIAFSSDLKSPAAGRFNGTVRTDGDGHARFAVPAGVQTKIRVYAADYTSEPQIMTLAQGQEVGAAPFTLPDLVKAKYRFVTPAGGSIHAPMLRKKSDGLVTANLQVQPSSDPEVVEVLRKPNVPLAIDLWLTPKDFVAVTLPPLSESVSEPIPIAVAADTWTARIARPTAVSEGELVTVVIPGAARPIFEKEVPFGAFLDLSLPRPESANSPLTVWVLKDGHPVGIWNWTVAQKTWAEGQAPAELSKPEVTWAPQVLDAEGSPIPGATVGARLGDRTVYAEVTNTEGRATLSAIPSSELTFYVVAPQYAPWILEPPHAGSSLPATVPLARVSWLELRQLSEDHGSEKWSFTPPEEILEGNRANDRGTRIFRVPTGAVVRIPIWVTGGRFGRARQSGPLDTSVVDSIDLAFVPGETITLDLTQGLTDGVASMVASTGGLSPANLAWGALSTDDKFLAVGRIQNDGSFDIRGFVDGAVVDVFPMAMGALSPGSNPEEVRRRIEALRANPLTRESVATIKIRAGRSGQSAGNPVGVDFSSIAATVALRPDALLPGESLDLRVVPNVFSSVNESFRARYELQNGDEVQLAAGAYVVRLRLQSPRAIPGYTLVSQPGLAGSAVFERSMEVKPGERIELP